ncbi:ABC transporter, substrate-binding protein, family 5 [Acetobacteraceae bacterium AT-5844]|nr:ABC transporter, substrate-binding protein, family 5 [Acetobacteraceae bacterium AT-5844]
MTRPSLCTASVILGLLTAGPGLAQSPGDYTIRAALNSDIRSTQPGGNRDANTDVVMMHVVEGLVAYREDTSVGPMLAESWTVSDDGRSYTFKLREGVVFHNGAPVTSAEVVWSWRRYLTPATQWRCLPDLDGRGLAKVVSVEATDPRAVTITLDKPSAIFLSIIARADCGQTAVLHPDSVGPDGQWREPIGTGPYRLGEWRRGQSVELTRFDGYSSRGGEMDGFTGGKIAYAARLRFIVIPDASAARAALLSDSVDVLTDIPMAEAMDLRQRPEVTLLHTPTMGATAFLLQTRDALLKDPRVRRAFALSLDVQQIVDGTMEGMAEQNPSIVPIRSRWHGGDQSRRPQRDVAAARRLLAEAGYRGQPIRMQVNRRYANTYDAAVAAQAMAQEAGLNIELEVLDWATQLDRYTRGEYQMQSFIYSARLDPSLSYEMIAGPKDVQPRKVWDNPEAQELIQRSMQVTGEEERQRILSELFTRFSQDVPMIVLYNQPDFLAGRANIHGLRAWPSGHTRLWNVSVR